MKNKKVLHGGIGFLLTAFLMISIIPAQSALAAGPQAEEGLKGRAGKADVTQWFQDFREKLHDRRLNITPRYRQEYQFDSNILLESSDEKADSIFREMPGIEIIARPVKDVKVRLDYEAVLEQFVKVDSQNDENQYFESSIDYNHNNFYVQGIDNITHTSSRSGTTFTERIPRFENLAEGHAGYKWNRFTLDGMYSNFYRKFNTTAQRGFDYTANKFSPTLYFDLTHKISTFFQYAYTDFDYRHNNQRNAVSNQFLGGIQWKVLAKTSAYMKFGYERLRNRGINQPDGDHFISEIGLVWNASPKTRFDFGWLRSQEQATFANTDYFLQDLIFFRANQKFTSKLTGEFNFYYTNQDYFQTNAPLTAAGFVGERDDNLLTVNPKLIYTFTNWISADIEYNYNRRDSNAGVFDYTDHVLTVGVLIKV